MSYDIIYNKQFVKLRRTGEVIPMLLGGSNNTYEIGLYGRNGRRSRSWYNMTYYNRKGKLSEKPDMLLKSIDADFRKTIRCHRGDKESSPSDIRKHFGYYVSIVVGSGHCSGTSWEKYRSQFTNGIRNAMTIEQLAGLGVHLHFFYHDYGKQSTAEGRPASVDLKTEQEYFSELKKWREWTEKYGHRPFLSFTPSDTDSVLRRLRPLRRKVPRVKAKVEQDHYFILAGDDGYLVRYTSRGFRYSLSKNGVCKHFRTEGDAEKYIRRLVERGRHKADTWKVERVESPSTFWV